MHRRLAQRAINRFTKQLLEGSIPQQARVTTRPFAAMPESYSTKPETSKIVIGVIGAGANTKKLHIPNAKSLTGVEIRAVANRSIESATKVAEQFGIPKVTDNWRDIIDDREIDAVMIGTWPYMHRTMVIAALEAGKHVLTEARMAMNAAEARGMLKASQEHPGLVAQVVPSPFTLAYDATIMDMIRERVLGDLVYIEVRALGGVWAEADGSPLTWRQDFAKSGINIMTLGIFYEPLQRWVGEATSVTAKAQTVVKLRTDPETGGPAAPLIPDHLDILADFAVGAQAHIVVSSVTGPSLLPNRSYTLYGKEGTLHLDLDAGKLSLALKSEGGAFKEVAIPAEKRGYWRVEEEFVGAIRGEEPVRLTAFPQGVRYMEFSEAVRRSYQEGRPVALPLLE